MATVSVLSTNITNRNATPRVFNGSYVEGGMLREACGQAFITTADSAGSSYNFCQIPSNARVGSIKVLWNGAGGTTTAAHFGLWSTTQDGGGSVSQALFASAQTLSAALVGTEVVHQANVSGTSAINGMEKRVWERLGLASDPGCHYDVKAVLANAADNSGTIGVLVRYVT